jgi:hypothetical protein
MWHRGGLHLVDLTLAKEKVGGLWCSARERVFGVIEATTARNIGVHDLTSCWTR